MNKKIIGIVGFIGSGKGTISDHLVGKYGYKTESFAKSLKDATSSIFGWNRVLLEGDTKESREYREIVDEWWSNELGIDNFTPRLALQLLGTNVMRNNFHKDIWIKSLQKRLLDSDDNIIISDARFFNEIDIIKQLGGTIIRTKRGDDPEWFSVAGIINRGPSNNNSWDYYKTYMDRYNIHPSEYSWIGCDIDHVLENNGSIEEFHQKIDEMIKSI